MSTLATIVAARQALERLEFLREQEGWPDDLRYDELVVSLDAIADETPLPWP